MVNRKQVERYIRTNPTFKARGYTRISAEVYKALEIHLRKVLDSSLHMAQGGKTFKM